MGPVETNLRGMVYGRGPCGITRASWRRLSSEAADLLFDLTYERDWYEHPGLLGGDQVPELISEGVEAAEALGL